MIIGVIGKSGCGKSVVSKYLEKKGFYLIILDLIGKEIVQKPEIQEQLRNTFGNNIFLNGNLDRRLLGDIVFNSKESLSKLTDIIKAPIHDELVKQIKMNRYKSIVIDGYTMVGCEDMCDKIIGVVSPLETSLSRLQIREPHTSLTTLKNRILNQEMNEDICDYIINNDNCLAELEVKVTKIINDL